MKPTELTLKRIVKFDDRTIGQLSIDGKYFCDTLEDTERLFWVAGKILGVKIYGKTAIPPGRYEIAMTYSDRFKKVLPLLMNVPQYTGIRIHSGNTPLDTEGCIIVGKYDAPNRIIKGGTSKVTLDSLLTKLSASKGKMFITIS